LVRFADVRYAGQFVLEKLSPLKNTEGDRRLRTLMIGFVGWAKMRKTNNASIRVVDTALTVVGTLMVAVTWAMLRG